MNDNSILVHLNDLKDNPYQPRLVDDAEHIEKLARSIAEDGLLQLPTARRMDDGTYQLAFGHSRRKAFEWLFANSDDPGKYASVPVNVEYLTDEQMYRYAVTENVQRKDLDPIEQARAMKRYADEFGKTSKEIGELFGMSDATVRGKVRLLDLPTVAQEKLVSGAISEGTARQLLSIQKIASEKDIVETIERIEKNEDHELPETIIEEAVDNFSHVKEMWNENHRDGKPRSDWRGGWLLDMKKFPNELLPDLSVVEAVDIIDLDKNGKDYEAVREWIHNDSRMGEPDTAEQAWVELQSAGVDPIYIDRLRHLYNPPACSACPYYTKIRGTHYCGMKSCHERKTEAWNAHTIKAASKKLGIPIYVENDLTFIVLETYRDGHKPLFEKRHKDLRLIEKSRLPERGYYSQSFDGVDDDIFYVVAVGETARKLKDKGNGKGTVKIDRDAQRKAKALIEKKKELLWTMAQTVGAGFESIPRGIVDELINWKYLGKDLRPVVDPGEDAHPSKMSESDARTMLAWRLFTEDQSVGFFNANQTCAAFVEVLHTITAEWGMKPIKSLIKMAQQFDAEIEGVAVETKNKKGA